MVKKKYIMPELTTVYTAQTLLQSMSMDRGTNTITESDQILVKGDRGSRSDYNVWNEDWSK